jgi:bifunctional pyridoxal-dependent enzyme with beta-cystathionase and maltose regulon repressor activities
LALEEKKVANEEHQCLVKEERKLFFMDTSNMDERQRSASTLLAMKCWPKNNVGNQHECTFGQLWRLCRHVSIGGCL